MKSEFLKKAKEKDWKKIGRTALVAVAVIGGNVLAGGVIAGTHERMNRLEREGSQLRHRITEVEQVQDADLLFVCMNLRASDPTTTQEEDLEVCGNIVDSRRQWVRDANSGR